MENTADANVETITLGEHSICIINSLWYERV